MSQPRLRQLLAAVLAAAALTGGCKGGLGPVGLPYKIEVPLATWPGYEYFYLAKRKQLAAKQGLRLDTREYPDPQAIVHAYLRGELDVAHTPLLRRWISVASNQTAARW